MGILGTAADSRKKDRKKKPDELLSSVVRETAIPAAIELLRANTPFVFPSGTAWVILVLAADNIGGLSKRHGRDEAKGSIIELIGSDQIQTVATAEMLEEDVFGIIPTSDTLERMEEYSLLVGAEYAWAVVWQKPSGELLVDLVEDATLAQARAVASGVTPLREAVGDAAWAEHSGESASGSGSTSTEPVATADAPADADDDEIFDALDSDDAADEPDFDEPVFEDIEGEAVIDSDAYEFAAGEDEPVFDDAEAVAAVEADPETYDATAGFEEYDEDEQVADEPDIDPNAVQLVDQEQVRDVIARRFLSEDLDFEVRLDEFNATFAIGAPVVQIEVPQGATEWLGDQIAQLNRQANADLAQLRYAHEDELRTLYVTLMSTHVEQVIRAVATDRDGSRYKALKDSTNQAHIERQGDKERKILEAKARIVADYEAQAKKLAEQAAIQAEIQFKERHRAKLEREQADAVAEIERVIENSHTHDQQEILQVRRSDATLQMQLGTSRIFEVLAERQSEYLKAEEKRLQEWKAEIQRIVDDNRQADIVQANALAEKQRTTDEIGLLRVEQEALLDSIRSEHADRIRRLEDELERNRQDAIIAMQAREAEWRHNLDLEKEKTDSAARRAADLLTQMETVETSVERRFAARLDEAEADRAAYANALSRATETQGRDSKLVIALLFATALLSGLAGWVGAIGFLG